MRPWVVAPPAKKAAVTLHSTMLDARQPQSPRSKARVNVELPSLEYPFRLLLTPCTTFPGNPVFLIQGDKVTMLKLDR